MQLWVVGCVDLWSTETGGEPIQHYQSPGAIQVMALSPDSPVLGSVTGPNIRLDHANDQGYWRTLHQAQLPKNVRCTSWFLTTPVWCFWPENMLVRQVEGLVLVPGRGSQHPLAALRAGEGVYLLDPREEKPWTIHSVYGHPVTCLDTSDCLVAFGVKRAGWAMHDGGNKVCSRRRRDECG